MTERNLNQRNIDPHTSFGGLIYESDFNTEYCNGNIAQRIISDWKFDELCRKSIAARDSMSHFQ